MLPPHIYEKPGVQTILTDMGFEKDFLKGTGLDKSRKSSIKAP